MDGVDAEPAKGYAAPTLLNMGRNKRRSCCCFRFRIG